jgi:hypothetical protein
VFIIHTRKAKEGISWRLYIAESQLIDSGGTEIARGSGTSPARLWRVPGDIPLSPEIGYA